MHHLFCGRQLNIEEGSGEPYGSRRQRLSEGTIRALQIRTDKVLLGLPCAVVGILLLFSHELDAEYVSEREIRPQ